MSNLSWSKRTNSFFITLLSFQFIFAFPTFANESKFCKSTFIAEELAKKEAFVAPETNALKDSLSATIISSLSWLCLVQLIRFFSGPGNAEFFDQAFLLTVPIDISLSLISHAIAIGNLEPLKRFIRSKVSSSPWKIPGRLITNIGISSGVILGSWAISGITLESSHILAATGLSLLVYSGLQKTKHYLFIENPIKKMDSYSQDFLLQHPEILNIAEKTNFKGRIVKGEEAKFSSLLVSSIDQIVLSIPWEKRIGNSSLSKLKSVKKIIGNIELILEEAKQKDSKFSAVPLQNIVDLRRALLEIVLKNKTKITSLEAEQILKLGDDFDLLQSTKILEDLLDLNSKKKRNLYASSFIDQAIAVGIAGGVLLYHTNKWAIGY